MIGLRNGNAILIGIYDEEVQCIYLSDYQSGQWTCGSPPHFHLCLPKDNGTMCGIVQAGIVNARLPAPAEG
jgi:hypothetical protein